MVATSDELSSYRFDESCSRRAVLRLPALPQAFRLLHHDCGFVYGQQCFAGGGMQCLPSWLGGGQRKAKFLLEHSDAEAYRQIMRWMESWELKMVVEKRFPLEEVREAVVELQKGRTRGKIVVEVAGE